VRIGTIFVEAHIMRKKIAEIAVFIEFLAGAGLALFFHWVLHYPEAAYIIFGVGILLSLATYLLREDMGKIRKELLAQYNCAHEITFAIARIQDPECQTKANGLMAGAKRTIQLLQQGYIPLDETEFYLEAARYMDLAGKQVKAVDPVTTGWDNRGSLLNFYQANLRAVQRGVRITRIFIVQREEIALPEIQKALMQHIQGGINVRIAYRDELPTSSDFSGRDTNSSYDFAIYDGREVSEAFGPSGRYFGRKTTRPNEVVKFQHLYNLIEHISHTVTVENGAIALDAESNL
jgi:hypothetical protein